MILVTGATGNNGSEIITALLKLGRTDVRALVRASDKEPAKVAAWRAAGVEVVQGDLAKPATLGPALDGVQRMLLLSPVNPNAVELQGNAISTAKAAGIAHVVKFSMMGAALDSPVPLARWHRQSEEELERSGLAWTHVRPNDLMRYNAALLMPSIEREGVFYDSLGDAQIAMVAEQDVAEIAARALTEPGHESQAYTLTGPEALSFTDVAAALTLVLGKPVRYVAISLDEAREAMLAAGLPAPAVDLVSALRAYEQEGHNAVVTTAVADILGRPPHTFAHIAAEAFGPSAQRGAP
jgi:uncharacterized protein YbjT (DUF2867 family)